MIQQNRTLLNFCLRDYPHIPVLEQDISPAAFPLLYAVKNTNKELFESYKLAWKMISRHEIKNVLYFSSFTFYWIYKGFYIMYFYQL